MAGKDKYSWKSIEADYVTNNVSLEEIAARYNISAPVVRRKAAKLEWSSKRLQYKDGQLAKAKTVKLDVSVFDKAKFDAMSESVCDLIVAVAYNEFARMVNESRESRVSIDARDMGEIAKAVKAAQDIKYRALGIAPPKQSIEYTVCPAPIDILNQAVQDAIAELAEFSEVNE